MIVSMGELLIDFVAEQSGVSVGEATSFRKAAGGAPANVAVAIARLGGQAAFMGQVGDDAFGHFLAQTLAGEGVDIAGLRHSAEARTALAFVALAADGQRSFMFYRHPSADMLWRPEDIPLALLDQARILHFGSVMMTAEPARSATRAAVAHAAERGVFISFDPNLRPSLWPDEAAMIAAVREMLPYASLLKVSDEELVVLTGGDDVAPLWRPAMQAIVVTRGGRGSSAYLPDGTAYHAAGIAVDAVDTTGSGDAFVGGLLQRLMEHDLNLRYLAEDLRFANACGALTATQRGAIPALPFRAGVDGFLRASQ
jgi:fructokinase